MSPRNRELRGSHWLNDCLGVNGGRVVAEAVPERLITLTESHTGAALKPVLSRAVPAEALAAA